MKVTSIDLLPDRKPDIIADLEKPLPLEANSYDRVLCFNLLEHLYKPKNLLSEANRILKSSGELIGYVPFLVKFHPDPNDYFRYTEQALHKILEESGFSKIKIKFVGRGQATAAWSQIEHILPKFIRWPITYLAFALDDLILEYKPIFRNKYALGYIFHATK